MKDIQNTFNGYIFATFFENSNYYIPKNSVNFFKLVFVLAFVCPGIPFKQLMKIDKSFFLNIKIGKNFLTKQNKNNEIALVSDIGFHFIVLNLRNEIHDFFLQHSYLGDHFSYSDSFLSIDSQEMEFNRLLNLELQYLNIEGLLKFDEFKSRQWYRVSYPYVSSDSPTLINGRRITAESRITFTSIQSMWISGKFSENQNEEFNDLNNQELKEKLKQIDLVLNQYLYKVENK